MTRPIKCQRCTQQLKCLNCEADLRAALRLGRIRYKSNLASACIPLEGRMTCQLARYV